jgi:hypothetical protein
MALKRLLLHTTALISVLQSSIVPTLTLLVSATHATVAYGATGATGATGGVRGTLLEAIMTLR